MSFAPSNSIGFYVDESVYFPSTYEEFNPRFTDTYRNLASAINLRDISLYDLVERENGQDFFTEGNPRKFRDVYRKVINFGTLPNATTKTVAHNISVTSDFQFTRIYGVAEDPTATSPTPRSLPLPYTNVAGNPIELYITDTDVVIITGIDYSAYTRCIVVLEYTKFV